MMDIDQKRPMRTLMLILLSLLVVIGRPSICGAFTVSGDVTDSAGNPLPQMLIFVYQHRSLLPDLEFGSTYTNGSGHYSKEVTGWAGDTPSIYVIAYWKFRIEPAATYNNHHVLLQEKLPSEEAFTAKQSQRKENPDPDNQDLAMPVLAMDQEQNHVGDLRLRVNQALDFHTANKGDVDWELNYDINVKIRTDDEKSSFHPGSNPHMEINQAKLGPTGKPYSVYHEMAHYVQYKIYGDTPPDWMIHLHDLDWESNPGHAFIEGWAEYVGLLTLQANNESILGYEAARDNGDGGWFSPYTLWRGSADNPDDPDPLRHRSGYDRQQFESGEEVEGAVAGSFFELDEGYGYGFADNLRILVARKPMRIYQFREGWIDEFGSSSAKVKNMYKALQKHGIFFSRARFKSQPFAEPIPPLQKPEDDGNKATLGGVTYLRGVVTTRFELVTNSELGLENTVNVDDVRICWKPANDGFDDQPSLFLSGSTQTAFVAASAGSIEFDTTMLSDDVADYDLLVQGKNEHGFEDDFLPDWDGDHNPEVDTDEKYLKVLGAWYDSDGAPTNNKGGKVVVDNKAPYVIGFEP